MSEATFRLLCVEKIKNKSEYNVLTIKTQIN